MKHLIAFSLKRRFLNKTNKVLFVLLIILFSFGFFLDVIVDFFTEDDQILTIRTENIDDTLFFNESSDVILDERATIIVKQSEDGFVIMSPSILNDEQKIKIETLIYPYYQASLDPDIQEVLINYRHPEISYDTQEAKNYQQKHDNLFIVITALYFMMIGFSGMLAQEVVAEKTSNILEMIGTSVSLTTHYYSKIIIGWLSIIGQFLFVGSILTVVSVIRTMYDFGKGICQFLIQHGLIEPELTSFKVIIKKLLNNPSSLSDLFLSLVFLFIGILIVQLILVVVSTRVNSVEEAGALQNPFYIGLLFMYYLAMILNNPASMNQGWGFFLSFVPVFSMIFMPVRLMVYPVHLFEIVVSLALNVVILGFVIRFGEQIYVKNVLNFTQKEKRNRKIFQRGIEEGAHQKHP